MAVSGYARNNTGYCQYRIELTDATILRTEYPRSRWMMNNSGTGEPTGQEPDHQKPDNVGAATAVFGKVAPTPIPPPVEPSPAHATAPMVQEVAFSAASGHDLGDTGALHRLLKAKPPAAVTPSSSAAGAASPRVGDEALTQVLNSLTGPNAGARLPTTVLSSDTLRRAASPPPDSGSLTEVFRSMNNPAPVTGGEAPHPQRAGSSAPSPSSGAGSDGMTQLLRNLDAPVTGPSAPPARPLPAAAPQRAADTQFLNAAETPVTPQPAAVPGEFTRIVQASHLRDEALHGPPQPPGPAGPGEFTRIVQASHFRDQKLQPAQQGPAPLESLQRAQPPSAETGTVPASPVYAPQASQPRPASASKYLPILLIIMIVLLAGVLLALLLTKR